MGVGCALRGSSASLAPPFPRPRWGPAPLAAERQEMNEMVVVRKLTDEQPLKKDDKNEPVKEEVTEEELSVVRLILQCWTEIS